MKLILPILVLFTVLVGCEGKTVVKEIPTDGNRFSGIDAEYVNIITDSETGCKYIFVVDGNRNYRTTAMSPLIKASGIVDCE